MYIQFDYRCNDFDALENLPYGAKEITKDLYLDTTRKRFYYYVWGNANAYRYQYISMRVKSIDGVSFFWSNDGSLMRIIGMTTCDIFASVYGFVRHINGVNFTFDMQGNLLSYKKGVNNPNLFPGY